MSRNLALLAMAALLLLVAGLYLPSVQFGFLWDDPLWFGRVVGRPVDQLLAPQPDYHFYRPAIFLYNRLFMDMGGAQAAPLLHLAQVGWHLLTVALLYRLMCEWKLGRGMAWGVAGLAGLHPFLYQAVAWAAPQQPITGALVCAAWVAYLRAQRARLGRGWLFGASLGLFAAALFIQEGVAALAGFPLLVDLVLSRRGRSPRWWLWPAVYVLVAGLFGLVWLRIPRQAGYTHLAFDPRIALYFLQGCVYPLLWRPGGYDLYAQSAGPGVLLLMIVGLAALAALAWRARRGRYAVVGLAWAAMGLAPFVLGLSYDYVSLSSRAFYYAAPGLALVWVAALWPRGQGSAWRAAGPALLGLVAVYSLATLSTFQAMYATGAAHIASLVRAAPAGQARLLFVNFPDRYALRRAPYPLGYWGVTLAPVSVDLAAFPGIVNGRRSQTVSISQPWLDADERDAGPYAIDLRGVITGAQEAYDLARNMDGVYVSRYEARRGFALEWAGRVVTGISTSGERLPDGAAADDARFSPVTLGGRLRLDAVQVDAIGAGRLRVRLTWRSLAGADPQETVFVHLRRPGQPVAAQADGDLWLGTLPAAILAPGDRVIDQRVLVMPAGQGDGTFQIEVGLYDRVSGQRLPAISASGERLPDDAAVMSAP